MDFSETSLFEIEREMAETFPNLSRQAVLCDVRNATRVGKAFMTEAPDLVVPFKRASYDAVARAFAPFAASRHRDV